MPVVWVNASCGVTNVIKDKNIKIYDCPVYMTPFRTGLKFIFVVQLPTDRNPNDWVLKGTALLCQKE